MFYELKPESNNKDIYEIRSFFHSKIKYEPPHPKRAIPQCINWRQRYGHTRSFYFHKAKCVKCIEDHPTSNYSCKRKSNDIKCVLYNGNHPANYKDYMVYKELQKRFFAALWRKVITLKPKIKPRSLHSRFLQQDDPMFQS